MRYELLDYQRAAAADIVQLLQRGRRDWESFKARSSFALSAVTGAGKTVIATSVIEAAFFGSADLGAEPDETATFLWITDDPALNRQTLEKMLDSSDLLSARQLVVLDDDFLNRTLEPGHVYFINTQKLSKGSRLDKPNSNMRQSSFWDILTDTIRAANVTLTLILDEAHRGMRPPKDRQTIVQRIINGEGGSNPPAPIVWGISATIKRFADAMGELGDRTSYPHVVVDIAKVRASGLVKDDIGIHRPDESGTFSTTLLRDAVRSTLDYEVRWAAYSVAEDEPLVVPVLVVQVPDKADEAKLSEIVSTIESEWPEIGLDAIAHVFGEHEPIAVGSRLIPWMRPEAIQGATHIRVVLAKEAISTGWDCPRAEVLYSERPASDGTHIAQILGRMVRQPLARRIPTDDILNSVACYLPLFNVDALNTIKKELTGEGTSGASAVGPNVSDAPYPFGRNGRLPTDVFDFIEALPSITTPDTLANPLRRSKHFAWLLGDDAGGEALLPDADEHLTQTLISKLDGLAAQHTAEIAEAARRMKTVDIVTTTMSASGEYEAVSQARTISTHASDLDRDIRKVIASVKERAAWTYYKHRAHQAGEGADLLDLRVHIACLLLVDGVIDELEDAATKWTQDNLSRFAVDIKNMTGAARAAYRKVQEQTSTPELVSIELRSNMKVSTRNGKGSPLPTFTKHLYSDDAGMFPAHLNDWETSVVSTEIDRDSTVGWYRNPSMPTPSALRIAYRDDTGAWTSLQVDFIIVSRRSDGSLGASIVDPHGDHLADAKAKLLALADYAEQFGDRFVRIESIAKTKDGELKSLDLLDAGVREAVRTFAGGKVTGLYETIGDPYL